MKKDEVKLIKGRDRVENIEIKLLTGERSDQI